MERSHGYHGLMREQVPVDDERTRCTLLWKVCVKAPLEAQELESKKELLSREMADVKAKRDKLSETGRQLDASPSLSLDFARVPLTH